MFRISFSKIFFSNKEAIPLDRPVILALNHPTAFIDPIFVCTHIKSDPHFMLRGDMFSNAINRWLLAQIQTIPIYRFRDGFSNLKNNQNTFDICYKLLHEKATIIILAEGDMKFEKKLRPIQKGTARMAFGAYEKYGDENICIVPVGLNYSDTLKFRSEMMVEVGEPIHLKEYMKAYEENPRKAVLQITRAIQSQLNEQVIHIANIEDEPFVNKLLLMQRNDFLKEFLPMYSTDNSLLKSELKMAKTVNEMSEDEKLKVKNRVEHYFDKLQSLNVEDIGIAQSFQFNIKNTILLNLALPFFLLGYLINFLPFFFAKRVMKKAKRLEFHSSLRLGVTLGAYIITSLIFLIAAIFINDPLFWIFIFLIPFFCYWSLLYSDVFFRWNEARKGKGISKEQFSELVNLREATLASILTKVTD